MAINSKIILAKDIHIDREYKNVLSYSVNDMISLLSNNAHHIADSNKFSFIRTQNRISTPFTYAQCLQASYIAFQNPNYENKWFFAFVDDVYYKSDGCTEITFTVDSWTTFYNDWNIAPCLTVREHVADDTIGLHTLDEGLDTGDDFITEAIATLSGFSDYFMVAVETTYVPNNGSHARSPSALPGTLPDGEQYNGIAIYNRNVWGASILLFDSHMLNWDSSLFRFIQRMSLDEHVGDIRNIFIVPASLINAADVTQYNCYMTSNDNYPFSFDLLSAYINTPKVFTQNIAKQHSYTGFSPKNNKCYCWPYNFIEVTNNSGNRNLYKYEQFSGANASFKIALALAIGCSGRLTPTNYKNQPENHDEDLALGKFPVCSWSSDAYTNFLTQESINNMKNILFSGINGYMNTGKSAVGAMTKEGNISASNITASGVGSVASAGASAILSLASVGADIVGDRISREMAPENYAGSNTGTVAFSDELITFVFKNKRVKTENLRCIDDYFTKFGYRVARVKTPELTSRKYWNYIEIGQSENIGYGNVPKAHMDIINSICRRGTTIWHSHDNIGNYNLTNSIVSN